ncbi:MAG TPA: NAD(P)/FAD-dependent oxidoreductase, partial [Vicinamibacterales bacterium]|nr:NAD(P)/FAD-dependent oxidoreductase [Vicinamibacterales bacterium]
LEGPDGDATVIESEVGPAALLIRRLEFDGLLVSLAVEAGAHFIDGLHVSRVNVEAEGVLIKGRDGRQFRASALIAADGVHSIIARQLGLNRGWDRSAIALDMMEETSRELLRDTDPSTLWVAYGYEAPTRDSDNAQSACRRGGRAAAEGYAYIFPKRHHVNIGIGYVLSHYERAENGAPYALQRQLIEQLRARGLLTGESVKTNFTPFLVPVGGPLRRPGHGRVLVAGDAAGFVNGFTAEGIYYAMVSGDLAARAILRSLADLSGAAATYRRLCNYEIGAELRDSVRIQRYLFADRRRIAAVITGARRYPMLTRLIIDLAVGRRSYREVRFKVLARAPLLATRLVWERLAKKSLC